MFPRPCKVEVPHARDISQKGYAVWCERDRTDLRERLVATKPVSNGPVQLEGGCRYFVIQLERMHVWKYVKTAR